MTEPPTLFDPAGDNESSTPSPPTGAVRERDEAPGRYRIPDHATSIRGAQDVAFRAGSQKAVLLRTYNLFRQGLTDEEAAALAELPPRSCWWKRAGELRQAGLIEDTGETRVGEAGTPRIVCRITDAGQEAVR